MVDRLSPRADGVWCITTVTGTKVWLDMDTGLWLRRYRPERAAPARSEEWWTPLRFGPALYGVRPTRLGVEVGHRFTYGSGPEDHVISRVVTTIDRCTYEDCPAPNRVAITPGSPGAGYRFRAHTRGDLAFHGTGDTPPAAVRDLAEGLSRITTAVTDGRLRPTRTNRWWTNAATAAGSMHAAVLNHLHDPAELFGHPEPDNPSRRDQH